MEDYIAQMNPPLEQLFELDIDELYRNLPFVGAVDLGRYKLKL